MRERKRTSNSDGGGGDDDATWADRERNMNVIVEKEVVVWQCGKKNSAKATVGKRSKAVPLVSGVPIWFATTPARAPIHMRMKYQKRWEREWVKQRERNFLCTFSFPPTLVFPRVILLLYYLSSFYYHRRKKRNKKGCE